MCNIKTLNLLPSVLASEAAKQAGADECVMYRKEADGINDRVTEGAHANVHCIKDGVLYTAPLDNLILPGISRKNLLRACEELGIPFSETPYSLDFIKNADEILVTSSSNLCNVATHLDGKEVGGKAKDITEKLIKFLREDYLSKTK